MYLYYFVTKYFYEKDCTPRAFLPLLSVGQILVNVPLSDGVLPATWQNVDVDGLPLMFFTQTKGFGRVQQLGKR